MPVATYGEESFQLRRGGVKRTIENAIVHPWGPFVRKLTIPARCTVRIYHFSSGAPVRSITLLSGTHVFGFPPGHNFFQAELRTAPSAEARIVWRKE